VPERLVSCGGHELQFSGKIQNTVWKFIQDESGQSTTEYILILSVCVIGASQLAKRLLSVLDKGILRLGSQLEEDLKTGRAPLHVWKN